jgi:hypothetical protein
MAVRASMTYIIAFVRELINDPDATQFTDQQIQDRLDTKRLDLYGDCLSSMDTLMPDGTIEWHDFFHKIGFWETDYVIQKTSGPVVTPDTAEPLIGKWHFNTEQLEPLVITGKVYNVYGVAVSLLGSWISTLKTQITSWTADGTTITRLGQLNNMYKLIDLYSGMAWGWGGGRFNQIKLVRRDLKN